MTSRHLRATRRQLRRFRRQRFCRVGLFHPPYGNLLQRLSLKLFLGKPDPSAHRVAEEAP